MIKTLMKAEGRSAARDIAYQLFRYPPFIPVYFILRTLLSWGIAAIGGVIFFEMRAIGVALAAQVFRYTGHVAPFFPMMFFLYCMSNSKFGSYFRWGAYFIEFAIFIVQTVAWILDAYMAAKLSPLRHATFLWTTSPYCFAVISAVLGAIASCISFYFMFSFFAFREAWYIVAPNSQDVVITDYYPAKNQWALDLDKKLKTAKQKKAASSTPSASQQNEEELVETAQDGDAASHKSPLVEPKSDHQGNEGKKEPSNTPSSSSSSSEEHTDE